MRSNRPRVRKESPYKATLTTIRAMEVLAKQDQAEDAVRELAAEAWHRAGGTRAPDAVKVAWVERLIMQRVEFMPDPTNVEYLQAPVELLTARWPVGDCDDTSTLSASCLCAMGMEPAYARVAWHLAYADPYGHVLTTVPIRHDGRLIRAVIDCTWPGDISTLLARAVKVELQDPVTRPEVPAWTW